MVHERGRLLTAAVLGSQSAAFVLFVCCVRAVGIPASQVGVLAVLLSVAVAGLVGAIPITLGGLGSAAAGLSGMLIAFGAASGAALAGDLVCRAATHVRPIFTGIVTCLFWKRGLAKGTHEGC